MKRLVLLVALAVVTALCCSQAWAAKTEAFTYVDFRDGINPTVSMCQVVASPAAPARATSRGAALNYSATLPSRPVLMMYDPGQNKLTIDCNGDSSLSDERFCAGVTIGKKRVFGPIPIKAGEKVVKIRVEAPSQGAGSLVVFPAGGYTGEATVDGKSYKVMLVDGNYDGAYDKCYAGSKSASKTIKSANGAVLGVVSETPDCDYLAIDFNQNKQFDCETTDLEVMPLPKTLRVNKSGSFAVAASADGSNCVLDKTDVKTGTVQLASPHDSLVICSENGSFHLGGGTETKYEVPVGTYAVSSFGLATTDKSGARWTLKCVSGGGQITVAEGATYEFKFGPPLVLKMLQGPAAAAKTVTLSYQVTGANGEQYDMVAEKNGVKQPLPKFRIIGESGKVVGQGQFAYG